MTRFRQRLAERQTDPSGRRWVFVAYDQLSDGVGPLSREDPRDLGIILVENPWKAARRPYHKQKLALVLANMRHFALEQAGRGVAVRHAVSEGPYREALAALVPSLGPLVAMEPAERELRVDLAPLVSSGALTYVANDGWLTTRDEFLGSQQGPPWRMDAFYRHVRRARGVLMDGAKPAGGKFSFDAENRQPWHGKPAAPVPPTFQVDEMKQEVCDLVERRFALHPGRLDADSLPATRGDAEALWRWAQTNCLPVFGPFEDAMSSRSTTLFHTRVSQLVNLLRLLPRRLLDDTLVMDLPLASKEAFVRQLIGWREFVHHVHVATDGFRRMPGVSPPPVAERPGDAGYSRWAGRAWPGTLATYTDAEADGGSLCSALGASRTLPLAYWGTPSGLECLDRVVSQVWEEGYSHHITRLMVLANVATLVDVSPRELTDWFWVAYADADDWVVEPNVLGMGTYGAGDLMTTKPYVAGSAYLARMSDYCEGCAFDPRSTCPLTPLYWAFLARHESALSANPRMRVAISSMRTRAESQKARDREVFDHVSAALAAGRRMTPDDPGGAGL